MTLRLGVDLGGSKIEIIALAADGAERYRQRVATPRGDYRQTLSAIAGLVAAAEQATAMRGSVGVGIPGAESPTTGRIKNANSTWLIGRTLRADLEALLQRPVRLANDANCFALSEAVDGAGQGAAVVFGIILGTGVGGGIVVDGKVIAGANRIAGEWGHNPLPAPTAADQPAPACYCGRHGCIEAYLSGPAISADHARHGGGELSAQAIADAAARGDAACAATLARHAERLARALAAVVNVLDPDVIVVGGGLSRIDTLYDEVPRRWSAAIFAQAGAAAAEPIATRLCRNRHGDSSGVRGAAWLWS